MRVQIFITLCLIGAAAAMFQLTEEHKQEVHYTAFQNFMSLYNKQYESTEEYFERFGHFKASQARVAQLNDDSDDAVYGITKFSDMSPAEFKAMYLRSDVRYSNDRFAEVAEPIPATALPVNVDWRNKSVISAVKDQGQCGSCWAFSATETIESAWYQAKGKMQILSPQQIVSCDTGDEGCGGGWPSAAYQYVISAGGQETNAVYPYTSGTSGANGNCNFKQADVAVKISNWNYVINPCNDDNCASQNESGLAAAIAAIGPASICVDAETWQDYSSGVLKSNCPRGFDDLDHCVQLVGYAGYGTTNPYWIVRNSWGTSWGESGYIYIAYGSNLCGIADTVTQVAV